LHWSASERDDITGMPGRGLLLRALDKRLASGRPFALACVDFDGLKAVNDNFGYDAGNGLIRAVAGTIASLLRPGETVGRPHGRGGDEFVCLLDETDQVSLEKRCQALEAALDRGGGACAARQLLPRRLDRRRARERLHGGGISPHRRGAGTARTEAGPASLPGAAPQAGGRPPRTAEGGEYEGAARAAPSRVSAGGYSYEQPVFVPQSRHV
jgi:diguanylate cyclase (GGDEF)-like protein